MPLAIHFVRITEIKQRGEFTTYNSKLFLSCSPQNSTGTLDIPESATAPNLQIQIHRLSKQEGTLESTNPKHCFSQTSTATERGQIYIKI